MDTHPGRGPGPSATALVARAQDGDTAAFELLVHQHQSALFRFAVRMIRDRGDAEDIVQDSLVTAWRRLPTLTDRDAFQPWLYRIAHRRCLATIRARDKQATPTADLDLSGHEQRQPSHARNAGPAEQVETAARQHSLDVLVANLAVDLRACWILTEVNGMTYPEASHALDIPISTVRGRVARARQQLAEGMSPWR